MNPNFWVNQFLVLGNYTENQSRDLLVAAVALGLGATIIYSALSNNARSYELGSVRILQQYCGPTYTRIVLVGVGSLCLFLGLYLVFHATGRKMAPAWKDRAHLLPSSDTHTPWW